MNFCLQTNATSEEYNQRPKVITKIKYKSDFSNYENSFSSDALKSSVCNNSNISISNIGSNSNNDSPCVNQISEKDNSATNNNTPVTNISFVNYNSYEPNISPHDNNSNSSNSDSSNNYSIKKCVNDNGNNAIYNDNGHSTAKIVNRYDDSDTSDNLQQPLHKKAKIGSDNIFQELQRSRG